MSCRAYRDLVISSLSNNRAGLEDLPPAVVLRFLKEKWTTSWIAQYMSQTRNPASRAFTESVLRCVVEARHAGVLDSLLSGPFGLDVNRNTCQVDGGVYSLVELAAKLHDLPMVKVLLKHGAKINETNGVPNEGSALRYAIAPKGYEALREAPPTNVSIVELLTKAGTGVRHEFVSHVIEKREPVVFELLMLHCPQHAPEWFRKGIFHNALDVLSDEAAKRMIDFLFQLGITGSNLDVKAGIHDRFFIDVVARTGNLELFIRLHTSGVAFTSSTLIHAVASGNWALVEALFYEGSSIARDYGHGASMWNAIGKAITTGQIHPDPRLLSEHASFAVELGKFHAVLELAVKAGDVDEVNARLEVAKTEIAGNAERSSLDYAHLLSIILGLALRERQIQIVHILISAIASKWPRGSSSQIFSDLRHYIDYEFLGDPTIVRAMIESKLLVYGDLSDVFPKAVKFGNMAVIQDLLAAGAGLNPADSYYEVPLARAIQARDTAMVKFLLNAGALANLPLRHEYEGKTLLSLAVASRDIDLIQILLEAGANPLDCTALREAVKADVEIFALFLQRLVQYPPKVVRSYANEALQAAIIGGKIHLVQLLVRVISQHSTPEQQRYGPWIAFDSSWEGETPLGTALRVAGSHRLSTVQLLLQNGFDPNEVVVISIDPFSSVESKTALLTANDAREIALVETLLQHGADVNCPANGAIRRTPLQRAAELGEISIVQLLIDKGACVNACPAYHRGGTALQLAAAEGYTGIAELLIRYGAEVNGPVAKVHGKSAIEAASENGRIATVMYLLRCKARLDTGRADGEVTAIKLARQNSHFGVVQLLEGCLTSIRRPASGITQNVDTTAAERYVCQECRKKVSNSSALARHMRTHSRDGDPDQFVCNACGYSSSRKDTLKRHRAACTKEGAVSCPECHKLFSRKEQLRCHRANANSTCRIVGGG